jgi:pyridoxine 5-phosphate synthase
MTAKLSVNLNRIALLRNSRGIGLPDLHHFARLAIEAGADGITVHPRPDERHITAADTRSLATLLLSLPGVEFNVEGNPFTSGPTAFMALVAEVRPVQCTLVPDSNTQATSDHGWDLARDADKLVPVIAKLKAQGARVSLFLDADPNQVRRAASLGVARVELYTKPWADAFGTPEGTTVLANYVQAATLAQSLGLQVNVGHDLNLRNLPEFVAKMPPIAEASIGHALTCDALEFGYLATVRAYRAALRGEKIVVS